MRKTATVFRLLAAYYAVTYLFYIYQFQSFIKDVFIAPLFFLVPAGFGLLIFSIFNTHRKLLGPITGLQLILSSAFLGFLTISLIYTEMNNHNSLPSLFFIVYPVINSLSLAGFYRARDILVINDTFRSIRNTFLLLLPPFLLIYYYLFIHFSPYPLRDIFMETHFMKGALEFSKYHIINIATGDTYFALLQVHTGLLHHYFNYSLINSQWILPFYLFIMYFVCFYCFYSSFIKDRFILTTAMGLNTICTSLMFSNSNNSYLIMLTVVFFSVLVSKNRERTSAIPVLSEILVLCGLSVLFFLFREVPSYDKTMLPYLGFYLLLMLTLSAININRLLPLAFVILLELIAPPYHRAASLYMPLMLFLYLIYFSCFQWDLKSVSCDRQALFKKVMVYGIICTPVIIALEIMITTGWPHVITSHIIDILNHVFLLIVGQRVSDNQGVVGTTAEFVRFVPPFVYLVFALLALSTGRKKNTELNRHFFETNIDSISFCTVSALMFLIVYYSPLPSIHRVLVFLVLMIFALTAVLFKRYYETYLSTPKYSKTPLFLGVAIASYTLIAAFIYDMHWKYPDLTSPYIAGLYPVTYAGWAAIILSLIALLFVRKTALISFLTILLLTFGLLLDRFNIVTKLYDNSYGYDLPESKVISHYSLLELKTAEQLGRIIKSPDNLMFSDPSTLGIFEAQTGINGFYTFENLGQFMLPQYTVGLKAIVRSAFPGVKENGGMLHADTSSFPINNTRDHDTKNMNIMLMLADFNKKYKGALPEARYALYKYSGMPQRYTTVGDPLAWNDADFKRNILWILNEKTIRWAYGEVGYYPMNKPFSESYIKKYILPYFDVVLNSQNSVLVLKLK